MEGDLYSKLTVDGKFAIRSLGSVNVLKAALDFEAVMRKLQSLAGYTQEQIGEVSQALLELTNDNGERNGH